MEWSHVLGIILGNAAWTLPMFFWNRSEARADARRWEAESREFHGRLCTLEERYIQTIERLIDKNQGQ